MTEICAVSNKELIEHFGETPESLTHLDKDEQAFAAGEIPSYTFVTRRQGRPRLDEHSDAVAFSHKETAEKAAQIRASAAAHNQTLSEFWREASTTLLNARGELQNA